MLNNILRQAYKEMSTNIEDFKSYVNIDDISIEYHDYGTDFDTEKYVGADINVKTSNIRVNIFTSKRHFIMGKVYNRLKSCRKQAFIAYKENVKTIKHELLHLYIYNKYESCKDSFLKIVGNDFIKTVGNNNFYDDDNIIFVLYCMILDLGYNNDITKYEKIYSKCLEIAEQYKKCYGNDTNMLNRFFELRLLDIKDFVAFNDYSLANKLFDKFTKEQKETMLDTIDTWENRISKAFDMLSILIKSDEKSA
ncbi:hypothetical protein [Intestinibacter bartlettii]|uniref:Peptidase MA-like domain-containing protein n=1 Tax=Intestinibacter bartlettii TaxID=261299 RepID=A0ABS6E090_9FIRM|nr:hypothetical protein [Intestinibacter bartlettii]MBU5337511.1 hypothetical protein [Intestinibacter bartlettii]